MNRPSNGPTLITRPRPLQGVTTGAQRAAHRIATTRALNGPAQPTRETRQNYRAALRQAIKLERHGK